jgi:hypothetical protein
MLHAKLVKQACKQDLAPDPHAGEGASEKKGRHARSLLTKSSLAISGEGIGAPKLASCQYTVDQETIRDELHVDIGILMVSKPTRVGEAPTQGKPLNRLLVRWQ